MDVLVTIHSAVRWIVLVALVAGTGLALSRSLRGEEGFDRNLYAGIAAVVDIQILIGAILYLGDEGWNRGTFIGLIHPIFTLVAAVVIHSGLVWARRAAASGDAEPNRIVGYSMFLGTVLIILGIPWFE